jgi:nucleotide-binding universal stress UspA family protein
MALKDILVHIDNDPRSDIRLAVAVRLARQHDAHLTGIGIINVPNADYFYGSAIPLAGLPPPQVAERIREVGLAVAGPAETRFRDLLRQESLQGDWRLLKGHAPTMLAAHARYADLTIVGQLNSQVSSRGTSGDTILVSTLMSSGRPVLAIPFAGEFPRIGERVLVAWNASREATKAVNDALPLLKRARSVTILAINPRQGAGDRDENSSANIVLHLARHGIRAEATRTFAKDIAEGEALLSFAADVGADLIVAGGYGRSRAREMVFGGVTRTLLAEMTVPVLLSH